MKIETIELLLLIGEFAFYFFVVILVITELVKRAKEEREPYITDIYETEVFGLGEPIKPVIEARLENDWKVSDVWMTPDCVVVNFVLENVELAT